MYKHRHIAVVVPAYNEELLIGETLSSIPAYVDKIYVVDDYSTDSTPKIIKAFADKNNKIIYIRHEENRGVGAAITSGYKRAIADKLDIVAVMAGDNQMDPNFLFEFLDPIVDGKADYTKGNRLVTPGYRKGMSTWRFLGNSILTFLTKLSSGYWQVIDPQNGYTAISRNCLEKLDLDSLYPRYGYCNNILTKMNIFNFKIMNIPHPARYGREKSKIRYGSYIIKVSRLLLADFIWRVKTKYIITNFHPLVLFYLIGAALAFVGVIGGMYSIYYKFVLAGPFFEKGVLSLVTFVFGLQFLLFAMVFDEVHDRQASSTYSGFMKSDPIERRTIDASVSVSNLVDPNRPSYLTISGIGSISNPSVKDQSILRINLNDETNEHSITIPLTTSVSHKYIEDFPPSD